MSSHQEQLALQLAQEHGVLRAEEATIQGIPYAVLSRLAARGSLERVARGVYALPDLDISASHSLAEASARVPDGVICLLSALRFHDLTTALPFEVWMALPRGHRIPQAAPLPLRFFRFSPASFAYGVEHHVIDSVRVPLTSPAKTVADCFKFRTSVGLDTAIEALRDYLQKKAGTVDALWAAAEVCRVHNVLRPYLEALV